jgi:hypothetical protein
MKKTILVPLAFAFLMPVTLYAVLIGQQRSDFDPGIRPFTAASLQAEKASEDAWFAHLQVLASDNLKGRRTGTPDFLRAADYAESQFKSIGLVAAGVDGYRQPVDFRSIVVDEERSSISLVAADGNAYALKAGSEIVVAPNAEGSVSVDAPAVFAGYCLNVPGLGLNDIKGLDLRGKIAVNYAGAPSAVHGPLKAYFRTPGVRWRALHAAGSIGLITITVPRNLPNGVRILNALVSHAEVGVRGPSSSLPIRNCGL